MPTSTRVAGQDSDIAVKAQSAGRLGRPRWGLIAAVAGNTALWGAIIYALRSF